MARYTCASLRKPRELSQLNTVHCFVGKAVLWQVTGPFVISAAYLGEP